MQWSEFIVSKSNDIIKHCTVWRMMNVNAYKNSKRENDDVCVLIYIHTYWSDTV